jgi:hypothetical protein
MKGEERKIIIGEGEGQTHRKHVICGVAKNFLTPQ